MTIDTEPEEAGVSTTPYVPFDLENGGAEILEYVTIEAYFNCSDFKGQHQTSLSGQSVGELIFEFMGYPRMGMRVVDFCKCWFSWMVGFGTLGYVAQLICNKFAPFWDPFLDSLVFSSCTAIVSLPGIMLLQVEFMLLLVRQIMWWLQLCNLYLSATANFYAQDKYWNTNCSHIYFFALPFVWFGASFDAVGIEAITPYGRCLFWIVVFFISLFFYIREGSKLAIWDRHLEHNFPMYGTVNMHDLAVCSFNFSMIFSLKELWAAVRRPGEFSIITASVRRKQTVTALTETALGCFHRCTRKIKNTSQQFYRIEE